MGLGISVGMLCDQARNDPEGFKIHRGDFDRLTHALAEAGIEWREPDVIHESGEHDYSGGFPYSYLAHLRRAFTLTQLGETVSAASTVSDEHYKRDQVKVADEMTMFSSHLLCHADYAGYYIPVDFPDPLFLPDVPDAEGAGMVGSTQQLLQELVSFAPAIGIRLDVMGTPEQTQAPDGDPFDAEKYAWLQLYGACRASIESGHAIVFC